jgi:hypothetical protein
VIFGLPIYNSDEAVKKQCEEAAPKPAVSKSACMATAAKKGKGRSRRIDEDLEFT